MHEVSFDESIDLVRARDPRYARDAYVFIREALDHTQKAVVKENRGRVRQHVSGQELLRGIRDFALAQYGPMTVTVLGEWGIFNCQDFGNMVFNMVEIGLLAKTDKDSLEDFSEGYDFHDAFSKPYIPSSRMSKPKKDVEARS